jgi:hypothetical protein
MEFLKKHYEKIAVAVVSLMMIATALILAGQLGLKDTELPDINKIPPGLEAKPLNTNDLMQIASLLKGPPAWRTNDENRPFVPDKWVWDGSNIFPQGEIPTTTTIGPTTDPADELEWWVAYRAFPMKFMAVVSDGVFQINIANGGSKFVKVNDVIRQTIFGVAETFTVLRYEVRKVKQFDASLGHEREVDLSTLTLLRKSADITKEVMLVIGKTISESDPVARCISRVANEMKDNLKKGSKFTYKGKEYGVVSLDTLLPQVVFKDIQAQRDYKKRPRVVQHF